MNKQARYLIVSAGWLGELTLAVVAAMHWIRGDVTLSCVLLSIALVILAFLFLAVRTERKFAANQTPSRILEPEDDLSRVRAMENLASWTLDFKTNTVRWSRGLYKIAGVDPDTYDLTGPNIRSWIHPDDRPLHDHRLEEARQGISSGPFECRCVRPDGEERIIQASGFEVIFGNDGKPERAFGYLVDITERKQAEVALRLNEQRLRAAQELGGIGDWVLNPATGSLSCSDQINWMIERNPVKGPIPLREILRLFSPADAKNMLARFKKARITGGNWSYTACLTLPSGRSVWHQGIGSVTLDQSGNITRIYGIVQDITDRKQLDLALRQSQEKYRLLVDNAMEAIYVVQDGIVKYINTTASQLVELPEKDILGHSISNLVPPEYAAATLAHHERLTRREVLQNIRETYHVKNNGQIVWVSVNSIAIDWEGRPATLNFASDITARKTAEAALRRSEQRYRLIAENMADVIWVVDASTRTFKLISPSITQQLGYPLQALLGQSLERILTPESIADLHARWAERIAAFQAQSPHPLSFVDELTQVRQDGTQLHTEVTSTFLLDEQDKIEVISVSRDVTERFRQEAERVKLQEQLMQSQKMESVGRLAGGVAHDFNNMLQAILGNITMVLMDLPEDSPVRNNLEEAQKCALRSAELTRQLLAFARKQTVIPRILDINETVAGMLKMLRRLIGEDITLDWHPAPGELRVRMDPTQLDQILVNLCLNSRDAITGGGRVTIQTEPATLDAETWSGSPGLIPGNYILLTVSDTGMGMTPEVIDHIFEPFFTTKDIGQGTGLGLATVYGIVQQNRGAIRVSSTPGHGTTFRIFLPRQTPSQTAPKPQTPPAPVARGHETILLVEDESSILALGSHILQNLGYTVLLANTPGKAIETAENHSTPIHLVLTDVVMPEMDGRELVHRLTPLHPGIKRIFMSGYTQDVLANYGSVDKDAYFIQKPFTVAALARTVRQALDTPEPKQINAPPGNFAAPDSHPSQ
jgi:PAS domain S-box-containing protein